ncbi:plasmid recombination protein [Rhodovulum euryhalinum]|uniref:Plasmid recombination enzyme n=1 Tax=Rhodovulum euryhalinum TaxID=35805 RepID=A0A4R2KD67_9RHOB|nr:plasmid recombination protein [Rhodovulum euryhalinum]TCO70242.1 hypothetical protein EV655_1106 [Rhodovulum euryhalinum]
MTEQEKHPVVYRVEEIWSAELGRIEMHRKREGGDLSHIAKHRTQLNEFLIGDEGWKEQLAKEIDRARELNFRYAYHARRWVRKRKKEAEKIRRAGPKDPWKSDRSEGPLREIVLTANKRFFQDEMTGFGDAERERVFEKCAVQFLKKEYRGTVVAAWVDRDEEAYHIHAVAAPWVEKSTKNAGRQRMLVPGSIPVLASYEKGQDLVAQYFAPAGLVRGERRAARRREALENEREAELPRDNIPCHVWRQEEAVKLDEKRQAAQAAEDRARRLEDEARAARMAAAAEARRVREEQRARAAELAKREAEVSRRERMLVKAVHGFFELSDAVRDAARAVGMLDHPLVRRASDLVEKARSGLGRIGGHERTRG